jgi:hypothetical protein
MKRRSEKRTLLGQVAGPHTTGFLLRDVVDIMIRVNAQAYLIKAGRIRREDEFKDCPDSAVLATSPDSALEAPIAE